MSVSDAIERAQAWLADASPRPWNPDEMIYMLEEEPQAEVNAALAALGPSSVALAVALAPFKDSAVTQGVGHLWRCPTCRQCSNTPGTISHRDACVARAALAAWAEAVQNHD